jgi:hypothetical protein
VKRSPMPPPRAPLARRTALAPAVRPLGRRGTLAPESDRRKRERPTYRRMRAAVFERDGHACQAAALVPSVACWGPLDPQHVIPRSAWAGGRLVADNVLSVCRGHHEWIGANKTAAADLGLHGWSWSPRPPDVKGTPDV